MTTWNNTAPAVGNQISADIPDITENFAHLKSGFVRIFQDTWSDSDLTTDKIDTTVGFNDGTYNVEFPTNGIAAHSVIMLGNSSTIIWMYLNTAPPGWKVLTTGADTILAVAGGAALYNANGGTAAGESWANLKAHTHTGPSHNHKWYEYNGTAADTSWQSDGAASQALGTTTKANAGMMTDLGFSGDENKVTADLYTILAGTGASGAQSTADVRPTASLGKLYQLDTA